MKLTAKMRQFAMRWAIQAALKKRSRSDIPLSGVEARKNDRYLIYLLDGQGEVQFKINDLVDDKVLCSSSYDGKIFTEEKSLDIADLADFQLWVQHYYRGWTFFTKGIAQFLRYRWTFWPWICVNYDRFLQSRFNKRDLPRHDQMRVLRYILSETVKDCAFQTSSTSLLTHFYSGRWVHRRDSQELMTYYSLLLESMKIAHDIEEVQHTGYRINPKGLNTIAAFELEDQRHGDNKKTQNRIVWMTFALIFVGVVQAGAAAYETWLKAPEIFTGTIGGQAIEIRQE